MRRYTIAKTLALFLGALSVVARSLPERQSGINVRSPGARRFSDPLTKLDFADGNVDQDGDPKERLERLGLVMVSEGVLDGNIYTAIYSMSNNTAFPKRDTNDLQGARCNTYCAVGNSARTIPSDCENLYNYLYSTWGQFTVEPNMFQLYQHENCQVRFVNQSPATVTYDFWDFGGTVKWLNGECISRRNVNLGLCIFGPKLENTPYISVNHPTYF